MTLAEKAMEFAINAHAGQKDKSGKDYIMHPIAVASIISCIVPEDENLVAAAFLHDVLEESDTTWGELVNEFNQDITDLVREVTKEEIKEVYWTMEPNPKKKTRKVKTFPRLHTQRGYTLKFADMTLNASRMGDQPLIWQKKWIDKIKYWLPKTNLTK